MRRIAAVIGAGTMGSGIALLLARHGLEVSLVARREASLARAAERIGATLSFLAAEGDLEASEVAPALGRIRTSLDLRSALARTDLVIEAVGEDPDQKQALYRSIGAHVPPGALVASTTSGLNIFDLAQDFPEPGRLLIAHFWNPPYLVPLVEVVPGPRTSPAAVEEAETLLRTWGRVPVTLREYVPGFIGVRLNSALYREALDLIERGITDARGIDAVMRESVALRFPVLDLLEIADFGGLDTFTRVWDQMFPLISNSSGVPASIRRAVAEGAVGLKTGQGFHDYRDRPMDALLRERDRRLLRWCRERDRYRLGAGSEVAMKRRKISAPEFGKRTGAFSHAYSVDLGGAVAIYTAGQLAWDAEGNIVGGADASRQAEYIYRVIERILAAAGATLDDVVKTTAFITDIRDYPAVNEVRNRVFAGREPASTVVEVSKLVHPAAKVEIEAVAIRTP